jgi:hypothetical protein
MTKRHHPLSANWDLEAANLDGVPPTLTLPRAEFVRFAKAMYYAGAADTLSGVATGQAALLGPSDAESDWIEMARFMLATHEHIQSQKEPWGALLASIEAHNPHGKKARQDGRPTRGVPVARHPAGGRPPGTRTDAPPK